MCWRWWAEVSAAQRLQAPKLRHGVSAFANREVALCWDC